MSPSWPDDLDLTHVASPGLLVDADRVASNINGMVAMVGGDPSRLRPHVKTHKMSRVIQMQLAAGIDKFKAATIAEADMVAKAGGKDVLIAYQMVGPNVERLNSLVDRYPDTEFLTVVDHPDAIRAISQRFADRSRPMSLMIDVDCGMHRTGIELGPSLDRLRDQIESSPGVGYAGLHVYDGHLHEPSLQERESKVGGIIAAIQQYELDHPSPNVVGGGSPTFAFWAHAIWAQGTPWQCSPGTPVFWDVGYGTSYPDLGFSIAIALVSRVISKPGENRLCLDLGYKSVAAEMPLERRVQIPSIPGASMIGQSEEHLVVATNQADSISLGQAFLAFPRHVCPTVALHGFATVIRGGKVTSEQWAVDARAIEVQMPNKTDSDSLIDDPLVSHSLREAKWIVAVWVIAFVWVVGYCRHYGYFSDGETTTIVCGMPAWVFWGVALPWVIATLVSSWFALCCIVDEPLDEGVTSERCDDE